MRKVIVPLVLLTCMLSFNSFATEQINKVSIKIEADDEDFESMPELEVTTKSEHYSVDGYEITIGLNGEDLNPNEDEDDEDLGSDDQDVDNGPGAASGKKSSSTSSKKKTSNSPVTCEITLTAADGYKFSTMKKSDIKVSGFDANCTKASRQDSGTTLVLTVQLPGIKSRVGMVETATWDESGKAKWSSAMNANTYLLILYRDGRAIGHDYETEGTTYNFAPLMQKPGSYTYTVKAKDANDQISKRTESDSYSVSEEVADANRERYAIEYEIVDTSLGPAANSNILNGGWQEEDGKYWYRLDNGMFPQSTWYQIDGDWYWFDEDGYIITNQKKMWKGKEYFLGKDGRMQGNEE